jgi:hypothetical protein
MGGITNVAEMVNGPSVDVCDHPKGSCNGLRLSLAIRHDSDHGCTFWTIGSCLASGSEGRAQDDENHT